MTSLQVSLATFALCAMPTLAWAQAPVCTSWNEAQANSVPSVNGTTPAPAAQNRFRINYGSLSQFSNMTQREAFLAILRSAEEWNTRSTSGWLRYSGTTSANDLLNSDGTCASEPYSIVTTRSNSNGGFGNTAIRCSNSKWRIFINATPNNNDRWQTGSVPSNALDINRTLTHEFGHALGLWHPGDDRETCTQNSQCDSGRCLNGECREFQNGMGQSSTMATSGNALNIGMPSAGRHLYPNDITCMESKMGRRSLKLQAHTYVSGAAFNITTAKTGVVRGGGLGYGSGTFSGSGGQVATVSYDRYHRMGQGASSVSTSTSFLNSQIVGSGPAGAWWDDSPDRLRFFYNTDTSSNRYTDWLSVFDVFQYNYNRGLTPGNVASGYMSSCDTSSCATTTRVSSLHDVSYAHDNYTNDRVMAWTQQDRSQDATDNMVMVSTGYFSDFLLDVPVATPRAVRSETGVKVACGPILSAVGSMDCLLTYTDVQDTEFDLHVWPFYINQQTGAIAWGTELTTPYTTVAEHASWYSHGKFWLAYKDENSSVVVRNSSDGASWSYVSRRGYSVGPPRVAYTNDEAHGTDAFTLYLTQP